MSPAPRYSPEPDDPQAYTAAFDHFYTRFAPFYRWLVRAVPVYRRWIEPAVAHIAGPHVLEVSCGTGYLLSRYAHRFKCCAVDLNQRLLRQAAVDLAADGLAPALQQARVEALPYRDGAFDTVINTMALSGYPDGRAALGEMARVLKPQGRLVLIDVNYPEDGRRLGVWATRLWMATGDLIRDLDRLLPAAGFRFRRQEVGGLGSIHLYLAEKAR